MDIYRIGQLALPGVVVIMAAAAVLTLIARGLHRCENTGERAVLLSPIGKPAKGMPSAFSHDYDQHWKASIQTSHAGKGMTLHHDTFGRSMGAPEFPTRMIAN